MRRYGIFDMDGTLLDSMFVWDNAAKDTLARHGIAIPEGVRDAMRPMSLRQAAEYLNGRFPMGQTTEETMAEINQVVREAYVSKVQLKPTVAEALARFSREGMRMCVATATDEEMVEIALTRLGIRRYFAFILTSTGFGTGKDRPDIFLEAVRRLGAEKPGDVVVFEDALHAIQSAKAAGCYVCGVEEPSSAAAKDEIVALCDQYVKHLGDFAE